MTIKQYINVNSAIDHFCLRFPSSRWLLSSNIAQLGSSAWSGSGVTYNCLQVAVFGKTGYGKSTTLNTITKTDAFETNDISSCTRFCQAAYYRLSPSTHDYLVLADMPGIGESMHVSKEYLELYYEFFKLANVIVYIFRADQRDYTVDEAMFCEIRKNNMINKIVIGINMADKIDPISRRVSISPSLPQLRNLRIKTSELSQKFHVPIDRIIPYSASIKWNIAELVETSMDRLKKR